MKNVSEFLIPQYENYFLFCSESASNANKTIHTRLCEKISIEVKQDGVYIEPRINVCREQKKMCMKKSPIERSNWWISGWWRKTVQKTTHESNPLEYMLVSSMPKVKWYRCIYNIRNLHRNFCRALWIIKRKLVKLCECECVCMCISVCVCRTKMYRTLNQVQFSI